VYPLSKNPSNPKKKKKKKDRTAAEKKPGQDECEGRKKNLRSPGRHGLFLKGDSPRSRHKI
jgi:hypothetical protein